MGLSNLKSQLSTFNSQLPSIKIIDQLPSHWHLLATLTAVSKILPRMGYSKFLICPVPLSSFLISRGVLLIEGQDRLGSAWALVVGLVSILAGKQENWTTVSGCSCLRIGLMLQ